MTETKNTDSAQKLVDALLPECYGAKILHDGSVAIMQELFYTSDIVLGCDGKSYKKRFSFEDRDLADQRWAELKSKDDEPVGYFSRQEN